MNYESSRAYALNENTDQYEKVYPIGHVGAIYTKDDESETLATKLLNIDSHNNADDYKLNEYTIEGETTKIYQVTRDSDEFTIFEVSAPTSAPHEATQTLMIPATEITAPYFIDFSCMNYDDVPSAMIAVQTRGAGTLPPFQIGFNKGTGRYIPYYFNPDGTFELHKNTPQDNRKIKLGGYGYIQDRLQDDNGDDAMNYHTMFLYNCYVDSNVENRYVARSKWIPPMKIEMNGAGKIRFCICPTTEIYLPDDLKQFWESSWVEVAVMDSTGLSAKYKSSDGSVGVNGSFTSADGKTVTVKNGIITAIV